MCNVYFTKEVIVVQTMTTLFAISYKELYTIIFRYSLWSITAAM